MNYPLIKPKFYLQLFKELTKFIKHPIIEENPLKSTRERVLDTIGLFITKIAFSLIIAGIVGAFYDPQNQTDQSMAARFTPLMYLLVGGIVLPLNEEILFRLSLRAKSYYFGLTSVAFTYYVMTKIHGTKLSMLNDSFTERILVAIVTGLFIWAITSIKPVQKAMHHFWKFNFRWIYYFSCISFAWLHIFNFELSLLNIMLLPILTLPQLISATIAGYTRSAFGFQYPLVVHMVTNLLFISLSFIPGGD